MASQKNTPKETQIMAAILKEAGITEYEPRVVNQMLEFVYRYVTNVLDEAKQISSHAKKKVIEPDDISLAIQMQLDSSFTSPPPRELLLETSRQKNTNPLPLIRAGAGPRLPPDRFCLTSCNLKLKSLRKPTRIALPNQRVISTLPNVLTKVTPTINIANKTGPTLSVINKSAPTVAIVSRPISMSTMQAPVFKISDPGSTLTTVPSSAMTFKVTAAPSGGLQQQLLQHQQQQQQPPSIITTIKAEPQPENPRKRPREDDDLDLE